MDRKLKGTTNKNKDKKLVCKNCGKEFVFTKGEQAFYAERNFVQPSHCPSCRKNKKNIKKK